MVEYGRAEGYTDEDQTFEDYLNNLASFIKEKRAHFPDAGQEQKTMCDAVT